MFSKASIQHGPMAGRRITVGVGLRGSCRPRPHVRAGSSLLSRRSAPERVQPAAPTAPATKSGSMGFAVGASGLRACSCWGARHFGDAADRGRDDFVESSFGVRLVKQQELFFLWRLKDRCPLFEVSPCYWRGCPLARRIATFSSLD